VAEVLDREWRARQRLAPGVSTPRIDEIDRWARGHGALAGKVCGAGGGGCLLFIAVEARAGDLATGLRGRGVEVLPCRLAARGLDVRWS
jgi:D-glycero-alpha-D-manno-heptose-7-phosphate kinase